MPSDGVMPLCGVFGLGDLRDDRHVDGGSGEREVGELSAHRVCQLWGHQPGPPARSARYRCATAYPIPRMSMRGATGRGRAPLTATQLRLFTKKQ